MATEEKPASTFGAWLQRELDRREWKGADLARRLGVANGDVSRWLRGVTIPSPASIDKIADVLGADLDTLLTIAGHRPQALNDDPGSPAAILCAMVRRISWDAGRYEPVEALLRSYLEQDRRAREHTKEE